MTNQEYAASKGITEEELKREMLDFLNCEGYDDSGNEYETLDAWLARKQPRQTLDPVDGGRGAGMLGVEDY